MKESPGSIEAPINTKTGATPLLIMAAERAIPFSSPSTAINHKAQLNHMDQEANQSKTFINTLWPSNLELLVQVLG